MSRGHGQAEAPACNTKNGGPGRSAAPVTTDQRDDAVFMGKNDPQASGLQGGLQPSAGHSPSNVIPGAFSPGNMAATTHALNTDRLPPEFEHLRAEVDGFIRDCLSDEGADVDIPRRRRALLEYRARLHRRIAQVDGAIELRGLFDKRGKLRTAWLQRLEGLISSAKGLDVLLGLERRQKRVPSLGEVLQGDGQ